MTKIGSKSHLFPTFWKIVEAWLSGLDAWKTHIFRFWKVFSPIFDLKKCFRIPKPGMGDCPGIWRDPGPGGASETGTENRGTVPSHPWPKLLITTHGVKYDQLSSYVLKNEGRKNLKDSLFYRKFQIATSWVLIIFKSYL